MRPIEQDGFEIIPDIVPAKAISRVTESLEQFGTRRSRAGIRNVLRIPAIRDLAWEPALLDFAKQALGKGATPFRATLFDKSPHSNWLVVWHQDTALPLRDRQETPGWGPWSVKQGVTCAHAPASALEQVLAIRVHLDDSNEDNGPLKTLPATHNYGVLTDDQIYGLANEAIAVECLVNAGGILLMRPLLVHASSKAKSDVRRRVLHIEYASTLCLSNGLKIAVD